MVQNLARLDESVPEEAEAVYHTMTIVENITEFDVRWCQERPLCHHHFAAFALRTTLHQNQPADVLAQASVSEKV